MTAFTSVRRTALGALTIIAGALLVMPAQAQNYPISSGQRATAQQVSERGVPLEELAPNAPDSYTVKRGDTLWGISGMYLKRPWRWPELWGMNMQEVRNPHRIFPGQQLVLDKRDGRATLRMGQPAGGIDSQPTDVVRVSPRVRSESLADNAIPTLRPGAIEPFLAEPIIVSEGVLEAAPRIVSAPEDRVLITRGDRVYARGTTPLALKPGPTEEYRVFRQAVPLRDPYTRAVLGYEAQYLGKAALIRGEGSEVPGGRDESLPVPATLDVVSAISEMRIGDRLLPDPGRQLVSYAPRAPQVPVENAAIVSMYGDAVGRAVQNQVVVINKGTADGMESGHVLAILKTGATVIDTSQPGQRTEIKLPNERNGLLMVFRPFERLSYALVLDTGQGVRIGDRVVSPR